MTRSLALLLLLLVATLVACAQTSAPRTAAPVVRTFTNADASDTYAPLMRVGGAPAPLPAGNARPLPDPATTFADAIAYGAETESYALLIWWRGALALEHYYPGFGPDLRPEPASMHKSLLALVAAKAIEDGFIESPTTSIATYIPEWRGDPRGDITVEQLLTMSSGLAPLSQESGETSPARQFMAGTFDARETILNLPLEGNGEPHFHYANTISQLLLMVIENATGRPYADYLSERIWRPIGAEDAYVHAFSEKGLARGYAAFLARPLDWLRLGLLVKDDGLYGGVQIINADLIRQLKSPSHYNPDYGWQIWLGITWQAERYYNAERTGFFARHSEPYLADDLVYFDGFGGQRVIISQSEDLVIVRMGKTRADWDDAPLPNLIIGALRAQSGE